MFRPCETTCTMNAVSLMGAKAHPSCAVKMLSYLGISIGRGTLAECHWPRKPPLLIR